MENSGNSKISDEELKEICRLFFDKEPVAAELIDTSRGEDDFRNTLVVTFSDNGKHVLKLVSNDFTFPEKIEMWKRTVEEYISLGYYCPKIIADKNDSFPIIKYQDHKCVVYGEEFSEYSSLEDKTSCMEKGLDAVDDKYLSDIWEMTAKIAAKKLDYTTYPSAYCMFETFCPSDKTDEVMENALEWKSLSEKLPDRFHEQTERIWGLWNKNREQLREIYGKLPSSVFQADLNPTNILIDEEDNFKGVLDFNLCGRDVFLNYLMRESSIKKIPEVLRISSEHYRFSEEERIAAKLIYRCVKPLWWTRVKALEEAAENEDDIRKCLDETESLLTEEIDFGAYMGECEKYG